MNFQFRRATFAALLALVGCSTPELRIGAAEGVPAIAGSTEVSGLDTFTCGSPIQSGAYTITTKAVAGTTDCELTFDQDVEVITADSYKNVPDLQGTSSLLQAVELEVKKLSFINSATNMPLDLNTNVKSAVLKVNGQQVVDKAKLASLPTTVRLEGDALASVKAKVDARQPASVRATCVVVVAQANRPAKMRIDYEAQPTLVLGATTFKL